MVGLFVGSCGLGYSSALIIAILSPPLLDRYSAGVGALITKRSALGSGLRLEEEVLGELYDWFSEEVRGDGVLRWPGTSRVSWWPDS